MPTLSRRNVFALAGAGALMPQFATAAPATSEVHTADEGGAFVDSVLILGDRGAVLVDAQFNVPNATALADQIAATGRALETIVITHQHPDHVLGLPVLLDRFPNARAVAHPAIVPMIEASAAAYLARFRPQAPDAFADRVVIPEPLQGSAVDLEGARIDVLDPLHGDTALITPVHVPDLDLLVASDLAYVETHIWLAETTDAAAVDAWRASLDTLAALGAGTLVPGHEVSGTKRSEAIAHTRAYLTQWQAALDSTGSADALRAAMMEGNEALPFAFALDVAVGAVYPT